MRNKIQIVFDTSYLESKSYNYESSIFERIKNGVKTHKCMDVYLPQNIDCEIRAHLFEDSVNIGANLKKIPALLRKELLRDGFHNLDKISDSIHEIAVDRYELFLDELSIEIIKNDKECTDDLWDRYFSQKPPFSEKKKTEFPDAMALLSILRYFKNRNIDKTSIIIASCDKDWEKYCTDTGICIVRDDKKLIEELNKRDPLLEKPIIIRLLNEEAEGYINKKIEQYFEDIEKEPLDESEVIDFEIVDFSIKNISAGEIIFVTENEINLLYNVEYYAEVKYLDSDSWHRDSESKNIFYTESICGIVESSSVVEVNINIETPTEKIDIDEYDIEDDINIVSPTSLAIDLIEMRKVNREFGLYRY